MFKSADNPDIDARTVALGRVAPRTLLVRSTLWLRDISACEWLVDHSPGHRV